MKTLGKIVISNSFYIKQVWKKAVHHINIVKYLFEIENIAMDSRYEPIRCDKINKIRSFFFLGQIYASEVATVQYSKKMNLRDLIYSQNSSSTPSVLSQQQKEQDQPTYAILKSPVVLPTTQLVERKKAKAEVPVQKDKRKLTSGVHRKSRSDSNSEYSASENGEKEIDEEESVSNKRYA